MDESMPIEGSEIAHRVALRAKIDTAIKAHERGDDSKLAELSSEISIIEKDDPGKSRRDCVAYVSEELGVAREQILNAAKVSDELKPGDIIRYDALAEPHYAVVEKPGETIYEARVRSKFGPSGDIYEHKARAVLTDYGGETLVHLRISK